MSKIVLTGANRGIGLALAQQLSKQYQVIALCREASAALKSLPLEIIENIELESDHCIEKLIHSFESESIQGLINNAGIMERNSIDMLDFPSMQRQFQVNALGPLRVVKACLPRFAAQAKILMVTSRMGSIADNSSGGSYGYRMSKTALNMASVSLAHDLKPRGIAVGIVHPGYVRTDMTQQSGHINSDESARGILARYEELNLENSGQFWHQNGEALPW